jgi:5,10-methylenetetrahydrofolate reductase
MSFTRDDFTLLGDSPAKVACTLFEAGADFVLTQPVFSAPAAVHFLEQYAQACGSLPIPVIAGILPLASARHAAFLNHEAPGISIPEDIQQRMEAAGENATRTGVKIAVELIEQIRPVVHGVYLMPAFSRFDLTAEVIDAVVNA